MGEGGGGRKHDVLISVLTIFILRFPDFCLTSRQTFQFFPGLIYYLFSGYFRQATSIIKKYSQEKNVFTVQFSPVFLR